VSTFLPLEERLFDPSGERAGKISRRLQVAMELLKRSGIIAHLFSKAKSQIEGGAMNFDEMKSMSGNENWCVIIQSYPSKLKKDLVQRVSEIFSLEKKDAKQAISNTPLILIDGLSFAMAARIKNFFSRLGATVETTNHDMIKKNCFQVMWPEVPDLSFFLKDEISPSQPARSPKEQQQPVEKKSENPKAKSPFSFLKQTQAEKQEPESPGVESGDGETPRPKSRESVSQNLPLEDISAPVPSGATGEPEVETPAVSRSDEEETPAADPGVWERKAKELSERLAKIQDGKQKKSGESSAELGEIKSKLKERLMAEHAKSEQEAKDQGSPQESPAEKSANETGDLPELDEQNQALSRKVQELEEELRLKDIELGETDSIRDRCRDLESKIRELEAQREQTMNSVDGELQNLNGQKQSLESKVAELETQLTQARAAQSQFENSSADFSREKSEWAAKIGDLENQIQEKSGQIQERENHCATLQSQVDELTGKVAELNDLAQRRQSEWDEQMRQNESAAQTAKDELARLTRELETERESCQTQSAELNQKIEELETQVRDQQQAVDDAARAADELKAKEAGLLQRMESSERELGKARDLLNTREQALRERDKILEDLEKKLEDLILEHQEFEKIREENARFNEERADLVQKFEGQLAEQESKLAKMQEDFRRTRSRTERKLTAASRELGEWVRGVDALRSGLQKLIMFLASDTTSLEPEKRITSARSMSTRSDGASGGAPLQEK